MAEIYTHLQRVKSHAIWGGTYLYSLYEGVPPPLPSCGGPPVTLGFPVLCLGNELVTGLKIADQKSTPINFRPVCIFGEFLGQLKVFSE